MIYEVYVHETHSHTVSSMFSLLYRYVDKCTAPITLRLLISNVLTMYIIHIPDGAFDTAITVAVAHCLFIINHWPQVFKWLFNGLQGCDEAMKHSSEHLRGYSQEAGVVYVPVCFCVCSAV